jgi:hypothetical protein
MILIALLVFIILLAGIIFIGLMLMISYGEGAEVETAPLLQFMQWVGEWTAEILGTIAAWIDYFLAVIERFIQGM